MAFNLQVMTRLALGLAGVAGLLVGCAGARAPGQTPATEPITSVAEPAAPDDLDALETALGESEATLLAELGPARAEKQPEGAGAEAVAPAAQPPRDGPGTARPTAAPKSAPRSSAAGGAPEEARTSCENACKALSSMRRSAERICSLTSSEAERCTRARGRVEAAEKRLAQAECSCSTEE